MDRETPFSYRCAACGSCCRDKVITLGPYDVAAMARAAELSTAATIERFTLRRGSLLRFDASGVCTALRGVHCSIHPGRPLPCRLYPLGIERGDRAERFILLEAAPGSLGRFDLNGTVGDFIARQEVDAYLVANSRYEGLLPILGRRTRQLADFERTEPREFRRVAVREALAETNWTSNALIDALFDSDPWVKGQDGALERAGAHVAALEELIDCAADAHEVATAGVLLAVSLGFSPYHFWSAASP